MGWWTPELQVRLCPQGEPTPDCRLCLRRKKKARRQRNITGSRSCNTAGKKHNHSSQVENVRTALGKKELKLHFLQHYSFSWTDKAPLDVVWRELKTHYLENQFNRVRESQLSWDLVPTLAPLLFQRRVSERAGVLETDLNHPEFS